MSFACWDCGKELDGPEALCARCARLSLLFGKEAEYQQETYRFLSVVQHEARAFDPSEIADDEGCPAIDVRIQILQSGDDFYHSGSASYDTDHLGYWGSGSVGPDDDEATLISTARDMVEQALEMATC